MKFCIDDANVEKIRRIYEYYPIDENEILY